MELPEYRYLLDSLKTLGYKSLFNHERLYTINITKESPLVTSDLSVHDRVLHPKPVLRKICAIPDKELKTRNIALFDYVSQCVLKPIHQAQAAFMRKMDCDYTFDQDRYKNFILKYYSIPIDKRDNMYSIDLKEATDRFPMSLQVHFMTLYLGGKEEAEAWRTVMVGTPFCYLGRDYAIEREVTYRTGQPMGAYSSWTTFAMCHHIIILYLCDKLGVKPDESYCVLGDDALIVGDQLYAGYLEVMQELKVEVQVTKTFKSKRFLEFAKRFHFNGRDITPFPLGAFYTALGEPSQMSNAISNALAKS